MLAVAVKFTAVLLLPFLLLAVGRQPPAAADPGRRRCSERFRSSVLSVALFGLVAAEPPGSEHAADRLQHPERRRARARDRRRHAAAAADRRRRGGRTIVVLLVAGRRRRGDWVSRAGWATLALIASLAWLMPWYLIWLAPLAALGASPALRRAMLALTAFLVLTFMPATGIYLSNHGTRPAGHLGRARLNVLQHKLSR